MKNSGSATPVTDFAVPPHAPAAVVQAKETFDNVASKYGGGPRCAEGRQGRAVKDAEAAPR